MSKTRVTCFAHVCEMSTWNQRTIDYLNNIPYKRLSQAQLMTLDKMTRAKDAYFRKQREAAQVKQLQADFAAEERRIADREALQAIRAKRNRSKWFVNKYNSGFTSTKQRRNRAKAQQAAFRQNYKNWPNSQINKSPGKILKRRINYAQALKDFDPSEL